MLLLQCSGTLSVTCHDWDKWLLTKGCSRTDLRFKKALAWPHTVCPEALLHEAFITHKFQICYTAHDASNLNILSRHFHYFEKPWFLELSYFLEEIKIPDSTCLDERGQYHTECFHIIVFYFLKTPTMTDLVTDLFPLYSYCGCTLLHISWYEKIINS